MRPARPKVLVIGEAIADFLPRDAEARQFDCVLGGSGFNTALALARLGVDCSYAWSLSSDALGRRFSAALVRDGVDMSHVALSDLPTPVAVVSSSAASHGAMFALHLAGTAHDEPPDLDALADVAARHLHVASFAGTAGQAADGALALLARYKAAATSSYDPNIRAACLPPHAQAVELVEARVAAATVAKASVEDLTWLYPGLAPDQALSRWLALGARIAILTRGADGALAMTATALAEARAPRISLADTVGAGDAFTAGFVAAMAEDAALGTANLKVGEAELRRWLDLAVRVASATCTRPGADPPRRVEL